LMLFWMRCHDSIVTIANAIYMAAVLGYRGCKAAPSKRTFGFGWLWQPCKASCYS
jgi:hypothetical protein